MVDDSFQTLSTYVQLRDLLAAQRWRDADYETARLMLKVADRKQDGWLDSESIAQFPCVDLQWIDRLWTQYSKGRFGFSVQKEIWMDCGGQISYETECRLGDRTGWYTRSGGWLYVNEANRIFDLSAPPGHLPLLFPAKTGILLRWLGRMEVMHSALASRLSTCAVLT